MKPLYARFVTLAAIALSAIVTAEGQTVSPVTHPGPKFDLIVTYDAMHDQSYGGGGFLAQGAGVELYKKIAAGLGIVADGTNTQTPSSGSLLGLDLLTITGGPRFTESRMAGKFEFFAQGLAGRAIGRHGYFPCNSGNCTSASSLALQLGYGADWQVRYGLLVRLIQVDWVHTDLPNGATNSQHNFRFASGIIVRFQ